MALGRRGGARQIELWIPTAAVARGPGHPLYDRLNELLGEAGFDGWVEERCRMFYAAQGRPGIPPGVYFRMLLIGYFEGLESHQGRLLGAQRLPSIFPRQSKYPEITRKNAVGCETLRNLISIDNLLKSKGFPDRFVVGT